MTSQRILVHSGKHPFEPFDYGMSYEQTMARSGRNLGNYLFADAVFKYLYTSDDAVIDSDHFGFLTPGKFDPDELNEKYDQVVIPAANWLSAESREMLARYAEKIRSLKIPCVVIGLGAQARDQGGFDFLNPFREEAKAFLSAVSDRSNTISIRGEFTARVLKHLGFENYNLTGCPSFYRNLQNPGVEKAEVDRSKFKLAVNGNKLLLAHIRRELFDRYPSVLFSQGDILKLLKNRWGHPWPDFRFAMSDGFTMKLISEDRVRYFGDIEPWIEELKNYHFSIGTRIHGNIIAILAGIPGLVITHDSRTAEMADFYGIPNVPLESLKPGFDAFELFQGADFTRMYEIYPERLANMARFFEENHLEHTLNQQNGSTYYDRRIQSVKFGHQEPEPSRSLYAVCSALSPMLQAVKVAKRRMFAA